MRADWVCSNAESFWGAGVMIHCHGIIGHGRTRNRIASRGRLGSYLPKRKFTVLRICSIILFAICLVEFSAAPLSASDKFSLVCKIKRVKERQATRTRQDWKKTLKISINGDRYFKIGSSDAWKQIKKISPTRYILSGLSGGKGERRWDRSEEINRESGQYWRSSVDCFSRKDCLYDESRGPCTKVPYIDPGKSKP